MSKVTDKTPLRSASQTEQVRRQVEQVKDTLSDNMDLVLRNGGDLDDLRDHSEQIEAGSRIFKQRTNMVKRRNCRAYYKSIAVIAAVIIVIVVVVVLSLQ